MGSIIHDELNDPRLGFITIMRAEVTKDLRMVKVYFSVFGSQKQKDKAGDGLESAAGFIRKRLGEHLKLRFVPEIIFKLDESVEYSINISQKIERLKNEPKKALNSELSRTIEVIRNNKTFLITTHINPEADAIGSELAFSRLLKKLNKEGYIINESQIPEECKFLPGIDTIKIFPRKLGEFNGSTSLTINPERSRRIDCMVFLDCSELSRAGKTGELFNPKKTV